jgi:zinc transport system substrate-binding protein
MIRLILFLFFLIPLTSHAEVQPRVLVTIKPVHSLVTALLTDIAVPDLLLDGHLSPHGYQLRPSDALKLTQADVIIWVGPTLEDFIQKQLKQVSGKTIIQLTDTHHAAAPLTQLHLDPHRWLDPQLALVDTQHIAESLISQYPHLEPIISHNLKRLVDRLRNLDSELIGAFSDKHDISAMLYHDAWHYFTDHFHLNVHGIINPTAHQQPGARHLNKITETIKSRKTQCLLIEPQFQPRYINTLKKKYQLKILKIDPLAASQPPGTEAYFDMMRANTNAFMQCQ